MNDINDRAEWPSIYGFLMNRLRAVRQDFIVQNLPDVETNHLLELMIPFYFKAKFR